MTSGSLLAIGQALACLGGRQRRGQSGGSHHRRQHRIDAVALHQLGQAVPAGEDLDILTIHQRPEPGGRIVVRYGDEPGLVPPGLLRKKLHVAVSAESDDAVFRSEGFDHAKRISADRAGGTQNGDAP